jgi:hypothetical protein
VAVNVTQFNYIYFSSAKIHRSDWDTVYPARNQTTLSPSGISKSREAPQNKG